MRCPGGASGHETDKRSAASPANAHLLARGLNPDDGGAEMVIFDTPAAAASFPWAPSIMRIAASGYAHQHRHKERLDAMVTRELTDGRREPPRQCVPGGAWERVAVISCQIT